MTVADLKKFLEDIPDDYIVEHYEQGQYGKAERVCVDHTDKTIEVM